MRFSTARRTPDFAFAFDIDGVLLRESFPIPGASRALKYLQDNEIPFILLTNGGGKHETERVDELSKRLGIPLTVKNFVQSHTPFQDHVESLRDKTILVAGGHGQKCREVAEKYGFRNVVIPADIIVAQPDIWPFNQVFADYYRSIARALPTAIRHEDPANSLKIDAVFVFNDPRDWALDTQIILDLLLSSQGILGTHSKKNGDKSLPNNGWQQDGQPHLYFSNPDLFWASSYHLNRLGQGGFQAALSGIWEVTTDGAQLEQTIIGKPHAHTYSYAEKVLNRYRAELLGGTEREVGRLSRVFMVGDNPESDIRGANSYQSPYGTDWSSILVNTGVHRPGTVAKYSPTVNVRDALEAVKWALHQQGWASDFE